MDAARAAALAAGLTVVVRTHTINSAGEHRTATYTRPPPSALQVVRSACLSAVRFLLWIPQPAAQDSLTAQSFVPANAALA